MAVPQITMSAAKVVGDPTFKPSPGGMPIALMRVVASDRRRAKDGTWHDGDQFIVTAKAFKDLAEFIHESFVDGDIVICTGRMVTEQWTDERGQQKSVDRMILSDCGPSSKETLLQDSNGDGR